MLTEESCLKKYGGIAATAESIETIAFWILHHKEQHAIITNTWLTCFRTATEGQRLSLLYLVNDVCQKAKNQKYEPLKNSFSIRLGEAMSLARHDDSIIEKVKRIIGIWEERKIFKLQDLTNFRTSLSMTFNEVDSDVEDELYLNFDPSTIISSLEKYSKSEILIEKAQELLPQAKFDFEGKLKNCLKDRQDGERIMREIDEAHQKMTQFVVALEEQLNQHHRLIALLEQARSYYGQQLKDATTVEDAYQKFVVGIRRVKKELEDMQQTGVYLGASPPQNAPSPEPNDDPFEMGVEAAIEDLKRPGARDMFEPSDMDIDEVAMDNGNIKFRTNQSFLQSDTPRIRVDPRIERFAKSADAMAVRPNLSHPPPLLANPPPFISPWNGGVRLPPTPSPSAASPPMYNPATYGLPPPNFSMPPPGMGTPNRYGPPISPGYPSNGSTSHYPRGMSPPINHHVQSQQRSVTDVVSDLFHGNNSDEEDDYGLSNRGGGANCSNLTVLSRPPTKHY